jgi:Oxaloacetate decarboxylase, gamma chain.
MSFFGRLLSNDDNKKDDDDKIEQLDNTKNKSNMNEISDEIIAVITAAIASMESRPNIKLEVKAIRRIPQSSPVWNTTGRLERLARHLNA